MKLKRIISLALFASVLICIISAPAYGQVPKLPHAFYGNLTINTTSPAPAGMTVEARGSGVTIGIIGNPIITTVDGKYGSEDPFGQKLIVQGDIAEGAIIEFWINEIKADQTTNWHAGEITKLDLNVTAVAPIVTTNAATGIGTTTATLNGSLINLGAASSVAVSFQWGTSTSYGNETAPPQTMGSPDSFSATISGLSPNITYHFRAKAVGTGTGYGLDRTFTTSPTAPGAPTVTTNAATGIGAMTATLNGYLDSLGSASSVAVSFQWGTTTSYGNETAPPQTMGSPGSFSASLSGLSPNITYHFRAKAVGDGTGYGTDRTFTTLTTAVAPTVTTNAATGIGTTTATLNGYLDSLGSASSVAVSFQWGTTITYGNTATATPPTRTSPGSFSATISGLSPSTTYHFKAKAVGDGTSYGTDMIFNTSVVVPPGGGGGGEVPTPTPTPTPTPYYLQTNLFGKTSSLPIGSDCKMLQAVEATSEDGMLTITIPKDTVVMDKDGKCLTSLTISVNTNPPSPPEGAYIIGLAYDFSPNRATFKPPITFTWRYNPDALPKGVARENLVMAYYDDVAGKWVELAGVLDFTNNKITAPVAHLTTFAIIGKVTPTAFIPSSLVISPTEVAPGEKVNISISVANTGSQSGSYKVTLKINGVIEATKDVTVAAGKSESVSFTTSKDIAGTYLVDVNGLTGSFIVKPPVTPPTKPTNWPLIGGIIAAVIIVVLVIFFVVRRRD